MEGKSILKHIRIAPSKVRRVANVVKGKDVVTAIAILEHLPNRAATPLKKAINSAVSNVINKAGEIKMSEEDLFLKTVKVDTGSSKFMKRLKPRAMGRADVIRHRTSHVSVVVSAKEEKED